LTDHLEQFLGPIQGGWSPDATGVPFQVVWFRPPAFEGVVAYTTLGLSGHLLHGPSRDARQELVLAVRGEFQSPQMASAVAELGAMVLDRHRPILRGEILPPRDPIFPGTSPTTFYAAPPVFLPDEFGEFPGSDPATVLAWMVPVSTGEAELVASHGWPWFEQRLADDQPDLFDLRRSEIVHAGGSGCDATRRQSAS
jgi:hypothetical protein